MTKRLAVNILCIIVLHISSLSLNAQILLPKGDSIFFNISGTTIKLQPLQNNNVVIPQHISFLRAQSSSIRSNLDKETDNPLIHGATSLALNMKYKFRNAAKLHFDLITEHRGASYGVFNRDNIVVYPRICALGVDTLSLFGESIPVNIQIGNLIDTLLEDKLLFYNVNKHGLDLDLSWKSVGFRLTYYPDQTNGIGLNVDEYASISPYFQINKNLKYGIGLLFMERNNVSNLNKPPFLVRQTIRFDKNRYSFYLQGIMRLTSSQYVYNRVILNASGIDKFAFILGTKMEVKYKKLSVTSAANIRFYGKVFNIGHMNRTVTYRDTTKNELYANTVGNNLYPIDYYSSRFNQWAVSTEYQNRDILNVDFTAKATYTITPKYALVADVDFTRIYAENLPAFSYVFYDLGFTYSFSQNIYSSIFVTNKGMNLDVHYPTFYLYKHPYLGLKVVKTLDER